jgi:transcriptional regulator with XRE-family HTH domain
MKRSFKLIDHDPEIDRFKTLWREEHLKEADFAMLAGLSVQTVSKMFGNETKRPQHLTFQKMAQAMGYEYTLTREIKPVYETEIPKARAEFREHQAELKKRREAAERRARNGKKK